MNDDLAESYRILRLVPTSDLMERRAKSISKSAGSLTPSDGLDLIRLYVGGSRQTKYFTPVFRQSFSENDPEFPSVGNDLEMRMLAGLTLRKLLSDKSNHTSLVVALGLISLLGNRWVAQPSYQRSIISLARQVVWNQASDYNVADVDPKQLEPSQSQFSKSIAALQELNKSISAGTEANGAQSLSTMTQKLASQWKSVTKAVIDFRDDAEIAQNTKNEALDLLWWLLQWKSDRSVSSIGSHGSALLAGHSFHRNIVYPPGPIWARALLHESLKYDLANVPLSTRKEAVEGVTSEWKTEWFSEMNKDGLLDFCPVANEVGLSIDEIQSHERPVWLQCLSDDAIDLSDLAFQVYNECLLIQSAQS